MTQKKLPLWQAVMSRRLSLQRSAREETPCLLLLLLLLLDLRESQIRKARQVLRCKQKSKRHARKTFLWTLRLS